MTDICASLFFGGFFLDLRRPSGPWMSRGHSYKDQVAWNPKYFVLSDGQMRLLSEEKEAVRAESAVFVSCPSVHWCLSCQSQSGSV